MTTRTTSRLPIVRGQIWQRSKKLLETEEGRFLRPPEGLVLDGLRLPAIRFVEVREATDRPDPGVVSVGRDTSL